MEAAMSQMVKSVHDVLALSGQSSHALRRLPFFTEFDLSGAATLGEREGRGNGTQACR